MPDWAGRAGSHLATAAAAWLYWARMTCLPPSLSLSYWTLIASRPASSRRRGVSSGASRESAWQRCFHLSQPNVNGRGKKHRCCTWHTHTHTHIGALLLAQILRLTVKNKYCSLHDSQHEVEVEVFRGKFLFNSCHFWSYFSFKM